MSAHIYNDPTSGGLAPLQSVAVNAQAAGGSYTGLSGIAAQNNLLEQGINPITGDPTNPSFLQKGGGAGIALGAIQTLGSLWNSYQQTKLAKQSINLQTRAFETNLANQTKTYNTALEDRINARYATEGRSQDAASKIAQDRL